MTDTHISERYEFRNIKQNEAEEAAEIERICFPPNEAWSKKHMKDRVAGIAPMNEKFGFKDKGIAQSTWGGEEWHEMGVKNQN